MKTEFNVERVCERVHMCIVDAPEELGQPLIEVRNGSIHVSFPNLMIHNGRVLKNSIEVVPGPGHPDWGRDPVRFEAFMAMEGTPVDVPRHPEEPADVPSDPVAESNAQNSLEAGSIAGSQGKPKKRGK